LAFNWAVTEVCPAGLTVTTLVIVPPGPVQVTLYMSGVVGITFVKLPDVPVLPVLPSAGDRLQLSALELVQAIATLSPGFTVWVPGAPFAVMDVVGAAGGATTTLMVVVVGPPGV
jgi:hypothetical protein